MTITHQIEFLDGRPVLGTATPTLEEANAWLDALDPERATFRLNPEFEAAHQPQG